MKSLPVPPSAARLTARLALSLVHRVVRQSHPDPACSRDRAADNRDGEQVDCRFGRVRGDNAIEGHSVSVMFANPEPSARASRTDHVTHTTSSRIRSDPRCRGLGRGGHGVRTAGLLSRQGDYASPDRLPGHAVHNAGERVRSRGQECEGGETQSDRENPEGASEPREVLTRDRRHARSSTRFDRAKSAWQRMLSLGQSREIWVPAGGPSGIDRLGLSLRQQLRTRAPGSIN